MPKIKRRGLSREAKLAVIERMVAGEDVSAIARALRVPRKRLYEWRERYLQGGPEALRGPGRPARSTRHQAIVRQGEVRRLDELAMAKARIAELERKVGQQGLELDFFQRALRQVGTQRQKRGRGGPGSTRSSKK